MERAAADTRALAAHLASVVDELTQCGGWSGADADSFRTRWDVDVTQPLRAAADALDGIAFDEVGALIGALLHG